MMKLGGKVIEIHSENKEKNLLFSVSTNKNLPLSIRSKKAFIIRDCDVPEGFGHYIAFDSTLDKTPLTDKKNITVLPSDFQYLDNDDVIRISQNKESVRVLFRKKASNNSILITEQCNHYCLMCSQPPKGIDDSYIIEEAFDLIRLIPKDTNEIGFTGGEPTLFGDRFIDLLKHTQSQLPRTSIHILSNGRSFKSFNYAKKYAEISHFDMMVGIPIYSADPARHDYIVQSSGAFDETIQGILNLKRLGQKVEIRVVIHKQSIDGLVDLCEFIGRNLLFVDHVALMGLEMMGFTRANMDSLWIDPYEYRDTLSQAVNLLNSFGLTTSVYNHQLCIVNNDILPAYRKSISDWKNEFAKECSGCTKKGECGGFFSSGIQYGYSKYIKPFK
jgi:His-Xaa-Ser system radical SAM maturase HxsC